MNTPATASTKCDAKEQGSFTEISVAIQIPAANAHQQARRVRVHQPVRANARAKYQPAVPRPDGGVNNPTANTHKGIDQRVSNRAGGIAERPYTIYDVPGATAQGAATLRADNEARIRCVSKSADERIAGASVGETHSARGDGANQEWRLPAAVLLRRRTLRRNQRRRPRDDRATTPHGREER